MPSIDLLLSLLYPTQTTNRKLTTLTTTKTTIKLITCVGVLTKRIANGDGKKLERHLNMPTKIRNEETQIVDYRYDEGFRGRTDIGLCSTITTKASGFSGMPLVMKNNGGGRLC